MAPSWADRAEQMVLALAEMLGLEDAAPLALWPAGVVLLSVGLGLVLSLLLLLLGLHRPGAARGKREKAEDAVLESARPEEPKKRSRRRAGDKKLQRNGLAVELQEEVKLADSAELRADKAKKNKKKQKTPPKETKSAPSERKDPEEAGAWEMKVSNREKRQQRRKDKEAGDESGSPGGGASSTPEQPIIPPEEPSITISATPTQTKTTTSSTTKSPSSTTTTKSPSTSSTTKSPSSTSTKSPSSTSTTKSPSSTSTKSPSSTSTKSPSSTSTTKSPSSTSTTKSPSSTSTKSPSSTSTSTTKSPSSTTKSPSSSTKSTTRTSTSSTAASTAQRKEEPPAAEVHALVPQVSPAVSPGWEEVLGMNGSGWAELAVSAPVHSDGWSSLSAERQDLHSTWPHDMEGSWTLVDGSFAGLPAAGESPGLSCVYSPQVDDEWSGQSAGCVDPDWSMPSEEWGNYEDRPAEGAASTRPAPAELQDSDLEKDKEEAAAPGSSKAKKKKKKKKKLEDGGGAAQVEGEVSAATDQNTAGNMLPKPAREQESVAPSVPPAALKPTETQTTARSSAPPAQRKPEGSWESPKQVKKKKARRET